MFFSFIRVQGPGLEDQTAPDTPGSLSNVDGDGQVVLSWDASLAPDVAGYNVYRSLTSGSGYSKVKSLETGLTWTDTTVSNGIPYYYVVTAEDEVGNESGYSNEVTANPAAAADTTPPAAPTGLVATPGDTEVVLTWDANAEGDLDGYSVYRSLTSGSGFSKITSVLLSTTSYTDTGRTNGTPYYYYVTASDDTVPANESTASAEVNATPAAAGGEPVTIDTVDVTWMSSHLEWTNDFGKTNLVILQRKTGTGSWSTPDFQQPMSPEEWIRLGHDATQYNDLGLTPGTTYYYRIAAITNESAWVNDGTTPTLTAWKYSGPVTTDIVSYQYFDVQDYGADPTGSSNSYSAILSCYSAALAARTSSVVPIVRFSNNGGSKATYKSYPTDASVLEYGGAGGQLYVTYANRDNYDSYLLTLQSNIIIEGELSTGGERPEIEVKLWHDRDQTEWLAKLDSGGSDPTNNSDLLGTDGRDGIVRHGFAIAADGCENVIIRDLHINGTGTPVNRGKEWYTAEQKKYQWDISHKGIGAFNAMRNLMLDNTKWRNWRAEVFFFGGRKIEAFKIQDSKIGTCNSSAISVSASLEAVNVDAGDAANALVESVLFNNGTSYFTGRTFNHYHLIRDCQGYPLDQRTEGVFRNLPGETNFAGFHIFNEPNTWWDIAETTVQDIPNTVIGPWYGCFNGSTWRLEIKDFVDSTETQRLFYIWVTEKTQYQLAGGMDNVHFMDTNITLNQNMGNGARVLLWFSGAAANGSCNDVYFDKLVVNGNGNQINRFWVDQWNQATGRDDFYFKNFSYNNLTVDNSEFIYTLTPGSNIQPHFENVDFHTKTVWPDGSDQIILAWNKVQLASNDTAPSLTITDIDQLKVGVTYTLSIHPSHQSKTFTFPANSSWNTWGSDVTLTGTDTLEMTVVDDGGTQKMETLSTTVGYYVSNSGNDSNNGRSSSTPWKTLTKVNNTTFQPGDNIFFKKGDTWNGTIEISDSGNASDVITLSSYGSGDNPKIYGTETVTGWTNHSGNIYKATLANTPTQIFEDGTRLQQARWPNSGDAVVDSSNGYNQINDTSLPSGYSHTGSTALVKSSDYVYELRTVTWSSGGSGFGLNSGTQFWIYPNSGYILLGNLNYLTGAGQWHYDDSSNTLYVWCSDGANPSTHTITASTTDYGVNLANNTGYVTIKDIDFYHQAINSINALTCNNIRVEGCSMLYPNGNGFSNFTFSDVASDCTIHNNTITGANHQGIWGWGPRWTVTNNTIQDIGRSANLTDSGGGWSLGGAAICIYRGDDTIFRYNQILNCGMMGTYFFDCPRTTVEYNLFKNVGLDRNDVGALYHDGGGSWGSTETSEDGICRYNIIHGVGGELTGSKHGSPAGAGIYLDNYARDWVVEYNTVINSWGGGIFSHWGGGHTIRYNTVFDGSIKSLEDDAQNLANTWQYNTVYCLDTDGDTGGTQRCAHETRDIGTNWDYNTYINHYDSACFRGPGSYDLLTFTQWKALSGIDDANSTFDDSSLTGGHTEGIVYNATNADITIDLGGKTFYDESGSSRTGTILIEAWRSQILTGVTADFSSITLNGCTLHQP